MISFETFVTTIIAILLAVVPFCVSHFAPRKRITIIILFSVSLLLTVVFLYCWNNTDIAETDKLDLLSKLSEILPLPFTQKAFKLEKYGVIYIAGLIFLLVLWVIALVMIICDQPEPMTIVAIALIVLICMYPILWGEYFVTQLIYSLLMKFSYALTLIANCIINFTISFKCMDKLLS